MDAAQKTALLRIAHDLSRGDQTLIAAMEAAIANPPSTTETVGYYLSGRETVFENCFRKLASLLSDTPHASSAEDKYIFEIFDQWAERLEALPEAFTKAFWFLDAGSDPGMSEDESQEKARKSLRADYVAGVRALEKAFADAGEPLLCVDTGGGDTILFLNATPEAAERWRNVKVGETYEGVPLGIRSPMWDAFWFHVDYASRLELGDPPGDLARPEPLREVGPRG
jgi:hypothetical protein